MASMTAADFEMFQKFQAFMAMQSCDATAATAADMTAAPTAPDATYTVVRTEPLDVFYVAQNGKSVQIDDKDGAWVRSAWRKKDAMTGKVSKGQTVLAGLNADGLIVTLDGV